MSAKRKPRSQRPAPQRGAEPTQVRPSPPSVAIANLVENSPDLPSPEETHGLLQRLQGQRGAPILAFVTGRDVVIRGDVVEQVYEQLAAIGKHTEIDLFLHSVGGETEVPWRLITLIREFCDRFVVLIPAVAHSAATHIAMGADEIIMGPLSELSPVDPARSHPMLPRFTEDQPPQPVSVQDLRHCVQFIKDEIGPGIASSDSLAQILAVLFENVHPLAIGAIQQSYKLSQLISRQALSTHMDPETQAEDIEKIVAAFSDDFFSHSYRIARKEARSLGLNVTYADDDLWATMWNLYESYRAFFGAARKIDEKHAARPLVWLDTVQQRHILEDTLDENPRAHGQYLKQEGTPPPRWLKQPWTR